MEAQLAVARSIAEACVGKTLKVLIEGEATDGRHLVVDGQETGMRFGVFYELQLPKPWGEGDEQRLIDEAIEQVELADRLGIEHAWAVEHHFLDEYSHCSASDVFLTALAARTRDSEKIGKPCHLQA